MSIPALAEPPGPVPDLVMLAAEAIAGFRAAVARLEADPGNRDAARLVVKAGQHCEELRAMLERWMPAQAVLEVLVAAQVARQRDSWIAEGERRERARRVPPQRAGLRLVGGKSAARRGAVFAPPGPRGVRDRVPGLG